MQGEREGVNQAVLSLGERSFSFISNALTHGDVAFRRSIARRRSGTSSPPRRVSQVDFFAGPFHSRSESFLDEESKRRLFFSSATTRDAFVSTMPVGMNAQVTPRLKRIRLCFGLSATGDAVFWPFFASFLPLRVRRRCALESLTSTLLEYLHALVFSCFCDLFDYSGDGPFCKRSVCRPILRFSPRFTYLCRLAS